MADDGNATGIRSAGQVVVRHRSVESIKGRERVRYARVRMRAWWQLAHEPSRLGIYPLLRIWAPVYGALSVLFLVVGMLVPELRVMFLATALLTVVMMVLVLPIVLVLVIGLAAVWGRSAWRILEAERDGVYAAFRSRPHRKRPGYYLEDLWSTHPGSGLGFSVVVPAIVAERGHEPLHLLAATPKLVEKYAAFGFQRTGRGSRRPPNYVVPMTRPADTDTSPRPRTVNGPAGRCGTWCDRGIGRRCGPAALQTRANRPSQHQPVLPGGRGGGSRS